MSDFGASYVADERLATEIVAALPTMNTEPCLQKQPLAWSAM